MWEEVPGVLMKNVYYFSLKWWTKHSQLVDYAISRRRQSHDIAHTVQTRTLSSFAKVLLTVSEGEAILQIKGDSGTLLYAAMSSVWLCSELKSSASG